MYSETGKSQPLGPPFQWNLGEASFPTGTMDPRVGISLSPLDTNDGFSLSDYVPANNPGLAMRGDCCTLSAYTVSLSPILFVLSSSFSLSISSESISILSANNTRITLICCYTAEVKSGPSLILTTLLLGQPSLI